MNDLRVPVTLLVLVVLVFIGWFFIVHQGSSPTTTLVSTTTPGAEFDPQQVQVQAEASTPPQVTIPLTQTTAPVATSLAGIWRSTEDPNYSITVTASGAWTDTYKYASSTDGVSETGNYELFTSENPDPSFHSQVVPGVTYIKLVEGPNTFYYSVLGVTKDSLQISYLDRGNTLSFSRVQ